MLNLAILLEDSAREVPERTAIVDTVDDSDLRADLFDSGHAVALKKQMD